jgi:2-(1,2-epoxy-1,2-dihydrophenyl)acetyl-CoA isomerase
MTFEALHFELQDNVARVTFNQPDRGNPFDCKLGEELSELASECRENIGIRAVLFGAKGKHFSVGGDLKALASSRKELDRFINTATVSVHSAIARFARLDAPIVVAVHGMACGAAVGFAAAADFVIASPDAKFYAAFTGLGLACDSGSSYFLPRRLGTRRAAEFLLLNQTWDADEAARHGLINHVAAPGRLEVEAWQLAQQLASGPTRGFGEIKNLLLSSWEQPLEAQLELEARAMSRAARTEDAWAGLQAVAAKQKPAFKGT